MDHLKLKEKEKEYHEIFRLKSKEKIKMQRKVTFKKKLRPATNVKIKKSEPQDVAKFKKICYRKDTKNYRFQKMIRGKKYEKYSNNLNTDAYNL